MRPSEIVRLGRLIEAELRDGKGRSRRGRIREIVARQFGIAGSTYTRAKAVVLAAESGDPAGIAALDEMDSTGQIWPAWHKLTGKPRSKSVATVAPKPAPAIYKINTERQRQLARTAYRRLGVSISTMKGHAVGIDAVDVRKVLAVASASEIAEIRRTLRSIVRSLNAVDRALQQKGTPG